MMMESISYLHGLACTIALMGTRGVCLGKWITSDEIQATETYSVTEK